MYVFCTAQAVSTHKISFPSHSCFRFKHRSKTSCFFRPFQLAPCMRVSIFSDVAVHSYSWLSFCSTHLPQSTSLFFQFFQVLQLPGSSLLQDISLDIWGFEKSRRHTNGMRNIFGSADCLTVSKTDQSLSIYFLMYRHFLNSFDSLFLVCKVFTTIQTSSLNILNYWKTI